MKSISETEDMHYIEAVRGFEVVFEKVPAGRYYIRARINGQPYQSEVENITISKESTNVHYCIGFMEAKYEIGPGDKGDCDTCMDGTLINEYE